MCWLHLISCKLSKNEHYIKIRCINFLFLVTNLFLALKFSMSWFHWCSFDKILLFDIFVLQINVTDARSLQSTLKISTFTKIQKIKMFNSRYKIIRWTTKINCWTYSYVIYNCSENCIKISGKNEKWNCWKEFKMLDQIVIYQIVMLSRPERNENSEYHMNGI